MENIHQIIGTEQEPITKIDLYTNQQTTLFKKTWIFLFASGNQNFEDTVQNLNMNGNDILVVWDKLQSRQADYTTRRYLFVSKTDNRIIDIRHWEKEIKERAKSLANESYHFWYPQYLMKKHGGSVPPFRQGPVPSIHKMGSYGGLRHMKTTNERRQNSDPEVKQFVRGSRRPHTLVNAYDDIWRSYSRSWKDNKKVRHQWEHKRKSGNYARTWPVEPEEPS